LGLYEFLLRAEKTRSTRFAKLAAKIGAQIRAKKYVRLDVIKEGSGDAFMEETVYDARAFGKKPIRCLKRVLTSESGVFGPRTYECLSEQKIEWRWLNSPVGSKRTGESVFVPPLHKNPITYITRGTTFNAIHFNQRDRLDSTEDESPEESVSVGFKQAYGEMLFQTRFPSIHFPSSFRMRVTNKDGDRDGKEEEFASSRLTRFAGLASVLLNLENPLPGYTYRIVWELPPDEDKELNLSPTDTESAGETINRLLKLKTSDSPFRAQVDNCLANLEKEILSVAAFASPNGDNQLAVTLFAYDPNKRGLVCVAARGNSGEGLMTWVVKPGRAIVGQAFRRREEFLYIDVPDVQSEAAPYYELGPDAQGLPRHRVIFSVPLFRPFLAGKRVAVLSLSSRSKTSGLLCLQKDRAAMLALKEQVVAWHANSLAPALGLSGVVPRVLSPVTPTKQQTTTQAVDVVIVTIREDENRAVLDRLPGRVIRGYTNRTYAVGKIRSRYGAEYSIAVIRTSEQGPNAAQDTARDAIEDLKPSWILAGC